MSTRRASGVFAPSPCTRIAEAGRLKTTRWLYTTGMNERDETDIMTHGPVGSHLAYGFRMMDDNYDGES